MHCLARRRDELKEMWAVGNLSRESVEGTALASASAIGEAKAYRDILDFTFEQVNTENTDE